MLIESWQYAVVVVVIILLFLYWYRKGGRATENYKAGIDTCIDKICRLQKQMDS